MLSYGMTFTMEESWYLLGFRHVILAILQQAKKNGRRINPSWMDMWQNIRPESPRMMFSTEQVKVIRIQVVDAIRYPSLDTGVDKATLRWVNRLHGYDDYFSAQGYAGEILLWLHDNLLEAIANPRRVVHNYETRASPDDPVIKFEHASFLGMFQSYLFEYGFVFNPKHSATFGQERSPMYSVHGVEYLNSLDLTWARVFEFGSGGSTVWWSKRALSVTSIETSREWYTKLSKIVPENTQLHHYTNNPARAIQDFEGKFDVIVIDGGFSRYHSAVSSLGIGFGNNSKLAKGGFIFLDDSTMYTSASKLLRENGLIQVDFHGPKSGSETHSGVGLIGASSIFMDREFSPKPRRGYALPPQSLGGMYASSHWDLKYV